MLSFQMSVSGVLGCFPGEDSSKGFFLEPVSVAPSLQVFAPKGYDLHASVRALAEIASKGFETDSKDTFLPHRCALCRLIRFGSCPSCGLTWPGSSPYVQFFFAFAYSLGLLVWSMVLQFLSMLLVSDSWMLDVNEASSLAGQFKVKRQRSGKPICLKLSVQFSFQVIGRMAGAFIVAFSRYFVKIAAVASPAAMSGALHGCFALVGTFLSLVDHLASVLPLSLQFAWTVLQASEEVRQQATAASAADYFGVRLSTSLSPRRGPREAW